MTKIRLTTGTLFTTSMLAACQSHLPALDNYPSHTSTPKVADVVNHIQCELAQIVNAPVNGDVPDGFNKELGKRIKNDTKIGTLLPNLAKYNFVATAQITLEVTDAEGLTPSLSYMNLAATRVFGLGGQWNGTQDRTVTLNYAIDLKRLQSHKDDFCAGSSVEGSGLQGDLGLADIVSDGLLSLDRSAKANVYPSTGPVPASVARAIGQTGTIVFPPLNKEKDKSETQLIVQSLKGTMLFAPQSAGVQTQGTVTLSGLATLSDGHSYVVNWTGAIIPPNSVAGGGKVFFTLAGNLVPEPSPDLTKVEDRWGFNPTVTLTGSINDAFQVGSLVMSGVITPVTGSAYARMGLPAVRIDLPDSNPPHAAAGAASPAAKPSSAGSSSAGGTSFGSLVDFTLVYGLNGSPSYAFRHLKGITGSGGPSATLTRTKTDSLAITFVAACQDTSPADVSATSYWGSLGMCDEFAAARQEGASVGYQNNSLMILRNFLVRPE